MHDPGRIAANARGNSFRSARTTSPGGLASMGRRAWWCTSWGCGWDRCARQGGGPGCRFGLRTFAPWSRCAGHKPSTRHLPQTNSPSRTRTYNLAVNSRSLCQLSYRDRESGARRLRLGSTQARLYRHSSGCQPPVRRCRPWRVARSSGQLGPGRRAAGRLAGRRSRRRRSSGGSLR